jgi:iron complex transport system permease protein
MRTFLLVILVLLLAALDMLAGGGGIGVASGVVLLKLRLPRVLTALLAGSALSLSGMQMQAIFRNPLSDPHIMGVSAGAGLGAAVAVVATAGAGVLTHSLALSGAAFAGAVVVSVLILLIARRVSAPTSLLIAGVMLGFVFSAVSAILQYTANEESLKLYYSWAAGSFEGSRYGEIGVIAAATVAGILLTLANARGLDIILFGDDFASLSGADVGKIRICAMAATCLMTGAVTAFCGPVGFVGIIAPHIARRLRGSTAHRKVLPCALLTGSAIALGADILSRIWPIPLPVGSTMAFIGIPFIFVILFNK